MNGSAPGGPSSGGAALRARKTRFAVDRPIRYRPVDAQEWSTGSTANISGTGVLFRCDMPLPVGVDIELEIALNWAWVGRGIIRAKARTVRLHEFVPPSPGVAVEFVSSSLVPPDGL
jgi:hypothetical protein